MTLMMTPVKKEDADRDRFIEYLKMSEGVEYRTVDANVSSRTPKLNFDYLLRADSGAMLALEITGLTEDETNDDESQHHDFVRDSEKFAKLTEVLKSLIFRDRLPCSISISVPYHVPCELKDLNNLPADRLAVAEIQLMTAVEILSVGNSVSVTVDLGVFQTILQIDGVDVGQDVRFESFGGHGGRVFDGQYFAPKMRRTFPRKNQQLDCEADRRVLFICNEIPMTFDSGITRLAIIEAIKDFIRVSPSDVNNIDEIYVDFGVNQIERIYPHVAKKLGA